MLGLLLLVPFGTLFAREEAGEPVAAQLSTTDTARNDATRDSLTTALLAQNALLREHQGQLLTTVLWSLGAVVVLAAIGGIINLRVYQRDKDALRQELQGVLKEDLAELSNATHEKVRQLQAETGEHIAELHEAHAAATKTSIKELNTKLESLLRTLTDRILNVEADLYEHEANRWRERGILGNDMSCTVKMIEAAVELESDFRISEGIDRLRELFRRDVEVDAHSAAELVQVLERLPKEFSEDVKDLKDAIRQARRVK